jgi:hypothetical protein
MHTRQSARVRQFFRRSTISRLCGPISSRTICPLRRSSSGVPPTLSSNCVQPSASPSRHKRLIFSSLNPNQPAEVV